MQIINKSNTVTGAMTYGACARSLLEPFYKANAARKSAFRVNYLTSAQVEWMKMGDSEWRIANFLDDLGNIDPKNSWCVYFKGKILTQPVVAKITPLCGDVLKADTSPDGTGRGGTTNTTKGM